jgi:hypothetical protein
MGRILEVPMEAIFNGKADAWRRRVDDQRAIVLSGQPSPFQPHGGSA